MTTHKHTIFLRLTILLVGLFFVTSVFGQSDRRSDSAAKLGTADAQCVNLPDSRSGEKDPLAQEAALASGLQFNNVDHRTFGVGGMNAGVGNINVTGVSGPVSRALLYWHYIDTTSPAPAPNGNVVFNGTAITGASVGATGTNCWGTGSSFTMTADVTGLVSGNGIYTLAGFPGGWVFPGPGRSTNGVSLIVIYDDGNSSNNRGLYIFHGNDTSSGFNGGAPGDPDNWNSTLSGINWAGNGTPTIELHVADGQFSTDGGLFFNGTQVVAPGVDHWNGSSVPSAGSNRAADGNYWDVTTYPLGPPYFTPGSNNLTITSVFGVDCLGLAVAAVSVPMSYAFSIYDPYLIQPPRPVWFYRAYAGSDVYIRYTLGGYQGANPYSQPPVSQRINCVTKSPIGAVTPLNTYLGDPYYSAGDDYYTTIWRTNAAWAGTCRRVTLSFNDGSSHTLDYQFQ